VNVKLYSAEQGVSGLEQIWNNETCASTSPRTDHGEGGYDGDGNNDGYDNDKDVEAIFACGRMLLYLNKTKHTTWVSDGRVALSRDAVNYGPTVLWLEVHLLT
jgi:hypothetical protein